MLATSLSSFLCVHADWNIPTRDNYSSSSSFTSKGEASCSFVHRLFVETLNLDNYIGLKKVVRLCDFLLPFVWTLTTFPFIQPSSFCLLSSILKIKATLFSKCLFCGRCFDSSGCRKRHRCCWGHGSGGGEGCPQSKRSVDWPLSPLMAPYVCEWVNVKAV